MSAEIHVDPLGNPRETKLMQVFLLAGNAIMCGLCIVLVGYLRHHRLVAFKDTNASAARKIILPAFEPLLWIVGGISGVFTILDSVFLKLNVFADSKSSTVAECVYSSRQFVLLLVMVFMQQKSVSIPALRRAVALTVLLSTYTIPIVLCISSSGISPRVAHWILRLARAAILVFCAYVFTRPPARASKHTIREYAGYAIIYYLLLFTSDELLRQYAGKTTPYIFGCVSLLWGALSPLVIWHVLKADTEHWRGLGHRACSLHSLFRPQQNMHERISSQGLHLLIEMHRRFIIDFAYLDVKQQIGVGSSATVYRGMLYSSKLVAVKVYTPSTFTDEVIAGFSHEAALCGALSHANIVQFHGMCVCPPTICLVSELCQGSLDEITSVNARRRRKPSRENRQQFLIDIGYMIDAARAVSYIHSFCPAFLHRDIKPSNFLVDRDNTVKLTDFGESRCIPRADIGPKSTNWRNYSFINERASSLVASLPRQESVSRLTVRGTTDYMAPELIQGRAGHAFYGEAADVYSLAITMWDIAYPGQDKFPELKHNHLRVFDAVLSGERPAMDSNLHVGIYDLISMAWAQEARQRPSAQYIVNQLERIQEQECAALASTFTYKSSAVLAAAGSPSQLASPGAMPSIVKFVSGCDVVDQMQGITYVQSEAEATRLGCMLMDAGFLHHIKHAKPFENSEAIYYLDPEHAAPLCRAMHSSSISLDTNDDTEDALSQASHTLVFQAKPIPDLLHPHMGHKSAVLLERMTHFHQEAPAPSATSDNADQDNVMAHKDIHFGPCQCRKLGQRLDIAKTSVTSRVRHRFHRHHHRSPFMEETCHTLTTKLLEEPEQHTP